MATLSSGDTLSLNNLGSATGQGASDISLGTIKGTPTGGDDIGLSKFAVDSADSINGFTYVPESNGDNYTLTFTNPGVYFGAISSSADNFTWTVPSGTTFTLGTNSGATAAFNTTAVTVANTLQSAQSNTIRVVWNDGYNDHVGGGGNYNTNIDKNVFVVDQYDGHASELCLTSDIPVTLADGTTIEVGDVEEGMELKGYTLSGLGEQEGDYLNWETDSLGEGEVTVTVKDVVFSFAERYYDVNNGLIKATFEHPFLVKDSVDGQFRFKRISDLQESDVLFRYSESGLEETPITSIEVVEETVEIVSIDVEPQDVYLANGFVSHNKGSNSHTDFDGPSAPTSLSYDGSRFATWNAPSSTLNTGITAYRFQLDNNSDFSSPIIDEDQWSSTSLAIDDTTLNGGNLGSGTRYMRVRAIEGGLAGDWSGTVTISV
jgi:hypothetical protein